MHVVICEYYDITCNGQYRIHYHQVNLTVTSRMQQGVRDEPAPLSCGDFFVELVFPSKPIYLAKLMRSIHYLMQPESYRMCAMSGYTYEHQDAKPQRARPAGLRILRKAFLAIK